MTTKKIKFNCAECGKEKEDWAYRKPRFCSVQCAFKYASKLPKPWQSNRVNLICTVCGKDYSLGAAYYKIRGSKFCSRECKGIAKSISMRGEKNWNYIDGIKYYDRGANWLSQQRKAKKRDGYKCVKCNAIRSNNNRPLEVHHIIPYRLFNGDYKKSNDLNNLITLCRKCHIVEEKIFNKSIND